MQIIVSGQHLKLFPKLENYAIKKVEKLSKFHSKIEIINVHLVSSKSHREKTQDYVCELVISVPGKNLELVDTEESMEKAIDKAVERAKRLLVKHKEKSTSKKHKEGIIIRQKD